ncbi:hypothetical protein [Arcicella rosea]|uniref:Uncharacterized protein n=1 Tax=Arcicella rosea TaxID=502909 RepID=A0A841ERB0_9BACT|nr:hypothetical protein [Arcicella rosea]MBB6004824.1 hypothetical protein [Arcicella rosea]
MLLGRKIDILFLRFSSLLYGKLREKDRRSYLRDRMFHLFHAKNRKKDGSSYLRDSLTYEKDGMTYLRDSLLVLFDGLGYEKDGITYLRDSLLFLFDRLGYEKDELAGFLDFLLFYKNNSVSSEISVEINDKILTTFRKNIIFRSYGTAGLNRCFIDTTDIESLQDG